MTVPVLPGCTALSGRLHPFPKDSHGWISSFLLNPASGSLSLGLNLPAATHGPSHNPNMLAERPRFDCSIVLDLPWELAEISNIPRPCGRSQSLRAGHDAAGRVKQRCESRGLPTLEGFTVLGTVTETE